MTEVSASDLDGLNRPQPGADESEPAPPPSRPDRLSFAARQAAVLALCLIIGGGLVAVLRPDEAPQRAVALSPFVWAAVVWAAALLLDAWWFERSQIRRFEREPLALAAVAAVATLVIGLAGFDHGDAGRRIVYLVANAAGALALWWAVLSLIWILARLTRG